MNFIFFFFIKEKKCLDDPDEETKDLEITTIIIIIIYIEDGVPRPSIFNGTKALSDMVRCLSLLTSET